MTAPVALAGGARVIVIDFVREKLDAVGRYSGATITNGKSKKLPEEVAKLTNNWRRCRVRSQPQS
jgi:hypothetical protein